VVCSGSFQFDYEVTAKCPLNDTKIRTLKPSRKPCKASDWSVSACPARRFTSFRINGKASRPGLGAYPVVSLADARQQRIFGHGITTFNYLADSLFLNSGVKRGVPIDFFSAQTTGQIGLRARGAPVLSVSQMPKFLVIK